MSEKDPLGILNDKGATNDPLGILSQDEVKKKVSSEDVGNGAENVVSKFGAGVGSIKPNLIIKDSSKSLSEYGKQISSSEFKTKEQEDLVEKPLKRLGINPDSYMFKKMAENSERSKVDKASLELKKKKYMKEGKYNPELYKQTQKRLGISEEKRTEAADISSAKYKDILGKDRVEFSRSNVSPLQYPDKVLNPKSLDKYIPKDEAPELTREEVMASLDIMANQPIVEERDKYRSILEQGIEVSKSEIGELNKDVKAKYNQQLKDQIIKEKAQNTHFIETNPTQQDLIDINSGVVTQIRDLDGNLTRESRDGSNTSWWLDEMNSFNENKQIPNSMIELNGNIMEIPTPLKKVMEDYYYYLYKKDYDQYKSFAKMSDLSDRELAKVLVGAIQYQQEKLTSEYNSKVNPEKFLTKPKTEGWEWTPEQSLEASKFLENMASDFLEKNSEVLASDFRELRDEEELRKYKQNVTDSQYNAYKKNGFILNPVEGIYYEIASPIKEATLDFARGITTLPRTLGLKGDFVDGLASLGEDYLTVDDTQIPSEHKKSLSWSNGLYKLTRGLADFGFLIAGTKGMGTLGVGSKTALFTTSFVATNDNAYQEGINAGLTKEQANKYALGTSLIQSALEFINPNLNLTEGFKLKVTPLIMKDIASGKAVELSIKQRAKEWFATLPPEVAQEYTQLLAEKSTNYIVNNFTGSKLNADITTAELMETGIITLGVTGLANIGTFKQTSDLTSNAVYQLSVADPSDKERMIRGAIESKIITSEDGQNLMDMTAEMGKIISGIPNKYNAQQKANLSQLIYQQQLAKKQEKEKVVNPAFEKEQPKTADKLQEEINVLKEEYDSENRKESIPGEVGKGQELKQAEPIKGGGVETISPSGDVQAYEKEVGYDIKDGHHRYIAYKELGAKEVPVIDENGNEVMVPIEQLKPTQPLQEKDRKVIEGLKESIVKGEKVEPINVINKSNINEKVSDQKGRQEGLLKTEATSPSIEGAMPVAGTPVKVDKPSIIQNTKSEVDRVIASEPNADGDGQTFNLDGTTHDKGGLVIPVISENLKASELTPERIADFVEANQDKLGGNAVKVGIYKFPNGQDVSIDLNIVAPREMREEAIAFGREAGQESLFDLDTFENVKTGSDGKNPKSFTAQEFKDIAKRFSGTQEVTTETSVPAVEVKDERPATEEESRKWEEDITKRLDEEEKRAEQEQAKEEKQQQPAKSEKKITEENKAKLKDQGDRIAKALKTINPKIEVIIYDTQEEFEAEAYKAAKEAGADEETAQQNKTDKGFFDPNTNKIHINGAKFITGENTLLHEGVHPILNAIEAINPQIIEDLHNQLKEIESDLGIKGRYTEDFAGSYDKEVRKMEALTEFIADVANGDIPLENKTTFEKVKDFFRKMLKAVGINMPVNIKNPNDLVQLAKDIKAAFEEGRTIKPNNTLSGRLIDNSEIKRNIKPMSSKTIFGKSGITKSPALDNYDKKLKDGIIEIVNPYEYLKDKKFMLTFPDDLFVGDITINGKKIAQGDGGVIYAAKYGDEGGVWASVNDKTANSFVENANKSLKINGEGAIVLVKGTDIKHQTSLQGKIGFLNTILEYAIQNDLPTNGIVTAIRDAYNISNYKNPVKIIELFNSYLESGRLESGQTMKEAANSFDVIMSSLIKNAREEINHMFKAIGFESSDYFDKAQLKKGNYLATTKGLKNFYDKLLKEDFLNNTTSSNAYALLTFNSELEWKMDKTHPSYPFVIVTKDGSPSSLKIFNKTFNTYGENVAIKGRDTGSNKAFGAATYTKPDFTLDMSMEDNPSQNNLDEALNQYDSVKKIQSKKSLKKSLVEDTKKNKFMTEDGEGNYVFYHYATQDLSKKGINPLAPRSNATGKDEQPLAPASYYYTEPDIKESMVRGQFTHIVKVPKDKVYPFDEDPLNLLPAAEKAFKKAYPNVGFDANKMVAWVSKEAEKRGYPITVSNWAGVSGVKNALRAQSPVAQKPIVISKPVPNTLNQTVSDPNFEYKSNRRKRNIQSKKAGDMALPVYVTSGAMKAMKAAVSKSKNLTDVTQAGIDYVKSTDWYLSMGTNDQMDVIDMIEHKFGNIYKTGVKGDGVITAETIDEALKKGIKVGERKEKAAQKDLTQQIKDVLRKPSIITKLSLPQYKALVNEARNVTNEKQLEEYKAKVGEILEKQSEKNIAKTKKDAANNNKTKIKKAAKNEKAFANDIPVLKEFARINPAYLDDIDQYNEIAEQLLNKQDRTISNDDVMNYVEMKQKEIEEKLKQKLLSANDDLLKDGTITKNMTLQEMRDALEGYKISIGEAKTPEEKLALRAERDINKKEELQKAIDQKLEELNKQLEGETLSTRKQEVIDSLNSIDRTNIKDEILQLMNRVIDNIIVNDSYARSGDIIIAYKTQEAIREAKFRLEELGYDSFDEFMDDEGNTFSKLLKYAQQKGYNTSQITDAIEKYNQLKGLIRNITDMQGLFSGHADMVEQVAEFSKAFGKRINKNNSSFKSQVRQALYSFVSQNYGGTDQDIQNDFNINKERLFESVKNSLIEVIEKVHAKKYRGRKSKGWSLKDKDNFVDAVKEIKFSDASRLKELLNLIPRNAIKPSDIANLEVYLDIIDPAQSAEEVRDQLNQDEKDLVDFMRKEFSKIKESLFETSEIWDNEVPEFVQNYLPLVYEKLSTVSKVTTKQSIDEQIKANSFAGGTINKSASGTTINRDRKNKLADDKKISTNFHYDMSRKFREALYQINTLPSRRTFGQIINDKGFRKILGGGNSDILHNYVVENIKTQLNITTADPMYTILSRTLSKIASSGSRMALGTFLFGRINQAAPPIIGAAIKMAGKGGGSIFIVPNKPNKNLFKHSNIKEALQTGAGFKTDYTVRDKRNIDDANIIKKGIRSLFSGADIASEALNNFTLSEVGKGDALGRRRAWMMYYKHYQKTRNNVKGFKWKNEYKNPNKAASAYADQQIESTQSSNTFSALSPILTKGRNFGDLIKNMYLGFQTFAITTRARLLNDTENLIKGIYSGDKKLIGESLQDITAVTVEFTTFATLKVAQGAFLTMLTVPLVKAILGIGDDEAEELVKQISFEDALKRIGGTVTRDLLFSGIPLADSPGAWFVNLAYKELSGADKNILYYKGQEDLNWFDGFGTYSPFLGSWASLATTAYKMKYGVPKLEKGGVIKKEGGAEIGTRALNERERDIYNVLLVHDMMRVLGIGDQSVNTIANKLRRIAEKEHAIGVFEGLYDPNKKKEEKPSGRSRSRLERAKQEKVKQEKSE